MRSKKVALFYYLISRKQSYNTKKLHFVHWKKNKGFLWQICLFRKKMLVAKSHNKNFFSFFGYPGVLLCGLGNLPKYQIHQFGNITRTLSWNFWKSTCDRNATTRKKRQLVIKKNKSHWKTTQKNPTPRSHHRVGSLPTEGRIFTKFRAGYCRKVARRA